MLMVFNSKYSKSEASVSQTMGRDAHTRMLSVYGYSHAAMRAKEASAPLAKSLKKFNPKMQAVKCVFELTYK